MSVVEYKLLGDILLVTVVAFFGVALPGYALVRRIWPESGWNLGGSVGTSVIRPLDLVIAGGFVTLYVIAWRGLPKAMAMVDLTEMTAGSVMESAIANLALVSIIPMVLFWRANLAEFFGLRWDGWKNLVWILPAFVMAMMILGAVMMQSGWPEWVKKNFNGDGQKMVTLIKETKDWALLGAMAFSAVVVAPVAEEVIFRGYLYPVVKEFSERWFAALFTGVLFGVVHFNLLSFPTLAVMGVALVVLYEVTGSLWVTIGCHAAFNGTMVGIMVLEKLKGAPLPQ